MNDSAFEIKEKLMQLEEKLLKQQPDMPVLLRDIHRKLKTDPDVVTILTEEECSILVNGLAKQTNVEITAAAVKKGGKKAMSKMEVGTDL